MDLFVSAQNSQCPLFFSINRRDSRALGIDALHHKWDFPLLYASPPIDSSGTSKTSGIIQLNDFDHPVVDGGDLAGGGHCVQSVQTDLPSSSSIASTEHKGDAILQ